MRLVPSQKGCRKSGASLHHLALIGAVCLETGLLLALQWQAQGWIDTELHCLPPQAGGPSAGS